MRILYIDCDTLRPDHMGCYGYRRNTSPSIDEFAAEGVRFNNCYVSDAPCLPSRASLFMGRLGIHTGVINHGGIAADPFVEGYPTRNFRMGDDRLSWMGQLRKAGVHTVSISPFAERHSAWWFYEGFSEMYNTRKTGMESAEEVSPVALDWIKRNAKKDNWFLQVNYWDPHGPYRAPAEFGNPFQGEPLPEWHTEEIRKANWDSYGPHSAQEPLGTHGVASRHPRVPSQITSMDDYRKWIDGYDCGIRYMDTHVGMLLDELRKQGVYDDLVIIFSSDHGENQGELGVYGDHQTADYITSRVPLLIRWPGVTDSRVDEGIHYQTDLSATVTELAGGTCSPRWDGRSFAEAIRAHESAPRDDIVVSQNAWSCQRSVRFDDYIMIRTYHDGLKPYPEKMLFNVKEDPHEQNDLTSKKPEVVSRAMSMLEDWHAEMMATSLETVDPMQTVLAEGGPLHTIRMLESYCEHLRNTGRSHHADTLMKRHGHRPRPLG